MLGFDSYPKIDAPFAMNDVKWLPSQGEGFAEADATPIYNGGTQITREKMNGLGYLATIGAYLDRLGYPYGHAPSMSTRLDIKYPKGAILTEFNGEEVREWISLVDNNDSIPFQTNSIGENADVGNWKPLYNVKDYNFFPDYSSRKTLISQRITSSTFNLPIPVSEAGWIMVRRTINGWSDLSPSAQLSGICKVDIADWYQDIQKDNLTINVYEGETASRLLPLTRDMKVWGQVDTSIFSSITIEVFLYPFEAMV